VTTDAERRRARVQAHTQRILRPSPTDALKPGPSSCFATVTWISANGQEPLQISHELIDDTDTGQLLVVVLVRNHLVGPHRVVFRPGQSLYKVVQTLAGFLATIRPLCCFVALLAGRNRRRTCVDKGASFRNRSGRLVSEVGAFQIGKHARVVEIVVVTVADAEERAVVGLLVVNGGHDRVGRVDVVVVGVLAVVDYGLVVEDGVRGGEELVS